MDDMLKRWARAIERAEIERVRVLSLPEGYRATSSSTPLASYALYHTERGWACGCVANGMYHMPCKHLAALADALNLDLLSEIWVELPSPAEMTPAAA